jgi:hypothetical protein
MWQVLWKGISLFRVCDGKRAGSLAFHAGHWGASGRRQMETFHIFPWLTSVMSPSFAFLSFPYYFYSFS